MIGAPIIVVLALVVMFAGARLTQRHRLERSFLQKWGVPKSEGANVLMKVTGALMEEGKDWAVVEHTARLIMNDLWMLEGEQTNTLAIVRTAWERHQRLVRQYTPESVLKLVGDLRAELGDMDAPQTKAGLDEMETVAREAYRKSEPLSRAQIAAMRDYFAEIENRPAKDGL